MLCPGGLRSVQPRFRPSASLLPSRGGFAGFRRRGEKDKVIFLYIVSAENVDVSAGIDTGQAALPLPSIYELSAGGESQPKSVVTQKIAVATSSLCFGVER